MEKVEEVISMLLDLNDKELDLARKLIISIKSSRNKDNANITIPKEEKKIRHRVMMQQFNPFLK